MTDSDDEIASAARNHSESELELEAGGALKPNSQLISGCSPVGQPVGPVPIDESRQEVELVARHEAGHVVVCFVLYGEQVVKQVELYTREAVRPQTRTYSRLPIPLSCRPPSGAPRRGNPAPVSAEAIVDAHGVLCYAGLAAEILHQGGSPESDPTGLTLAPSQAERVRGDREVLAALARTIGVERPADQFIRAYWDEAMRLLAASWAGVDVVSTALVQHGSLSGDRVDRLLVGAA